MLFILDDSLFADVADTLSIMGLLNLTSTSQNHVILVGNDTAANYVNWLGSLTGLIRQQILDLLNANSRRVASGRAFKKVTVRSFSENEPIDPANLSEVTLAYANQLATRPFQIYVENSRNDKRFLLAACTEAQRDRLDGLLPVPWTPT